MKTLCLMWVVTAALFAPGIVRADWMEVRSYIQDGRVTPMGVNYVARDVTRELGLFGCLVVSPNYAEGYIGPTFAPRKWMQVGAGAGLEQGSQAVRLGSFAWIGAKGADIVFSAEDGGNTGRYLKLDASYRVIGVTNLGWCQDQFLGGGPTIQLTKPRGIPVTLWTAALEHAWIVTIRLDY